MLNFIGWCLVNLLVGFISGVVVDRKFLKKI